MDEYAPPMQRVLLVGPRRDQRLSYEVALRRAGFEVESVGGGAEAVERLGTTDFDIVLTDVVLEDISGYQICRLVRSSARPSVPVLIVSSLGSEADIARGFRAGASGYLVAPTSARSVAQRVTRLTRI